MVPFIIYFLGVRVVIDMCKSCRTLKDIIPVGCGIWGAGIIAALVNEILIKHYHPALTFTIVPLIAIISGIAVGKIIKVRSFLYFNSFVCGIAVLAQKKVDGIIDTAVFSFIGGAGFIIILIIIFAINKRIVKSKPRPSDGRGENIRHYFHGSPVVLLIIGIIALIVGQWFTY